MIKKRAVVLAAIFITAFITIGVITASGNSGPAAPRLIAHAGGVVNGLRLTNSIQALDSSYNKGFRCLELDVDWTSDGIPVFVHDWGNLNWYMNTKYSTAVPTYSDFKSRATIMGLQFMDLGMLEEWLNKHSDAYIITDVKGDNVKLLSMIKEQYPKTYSNLIPQIYSFDEYDKVRELGYENIILTLYKLKSTEKQILDFCSKNILFGVAMDQAKASAEFVGNLSNLNIPVFAHTVNDYNEYVKLRDKGVYGVYTDYFEPNNWVEK
ncbi:MAG: glycerophosphodiester phosphodiesterase family protein [Bacillota bacterium]|nr:glycerophosphodiester phosphodiesterase family protein [Bacillota bacterium]